LFFFPRIDWEERYRRTAGALREMRHTFFKYCVETIGEIAPAAVKVRQMDEASETMLIAWQAAAVGYGMAERRDIGRSGLEAARDRLFEKIAAIAGFPVDKGAYLYFLNRFAVGHERFGRLGARQLAYYLASYITGNERWDEYGILAKEEDDFVPEISILAHWHSIAIDAMLGAVFNNKKNELFWHTFVEGYRRGIVHAEERMQYDFEKILRGLHLKRGGE
jgi:hypothetical protein